MEICKNLKELRRISGLKAYKIAEILGIGYRQLYRIENGESKLDEPKIEKLSRIYSIPQTDIRKAWEQSYEANRKSN